MEDNHSENALWFAEFKKQEAEKFLQSIDKALERTKARATNLLGWMITLTVAMGACSFSGQSPYKYLTFIMGIGFLITAILCVRVLYSTKWSYYEPYPEDLDDMNKQFHNSRVDILNNLSNKMQDHIYHNSHQMVRIQKYMRRAWVLSIFTPIITLFVLILFFLCLC